MITSVIVGRQPDDGDGGSAYAIDLQAAHEATESFKHQAMHDPLTGLPNRNGLAQQLHDLLAGHGDDTGARGGSRDRSRSLKDINDVHGHVGGDHSAAAVAQRISAELQPGEVSARIGGDEFVAVKNEIFARGEALKFARAATQGRARAVEWQHQTLAVGCQHRRGALSRARRHAADCLTQRADLAMYRAKSLGRGKICSYESFDG